MLKKKKLPEQLEFLKGINYFAIAEHKKGKSKKLFVEFQPTSIKSIISESKAMTVKALCIECGDLRKNVKKLKQENETLRANVEQNEKVIKLLQRDIEKRDNRLNPREKAPQTIIH